MTQRFGPWQLEALIAVGGTAEIWRARRDDAAWAAVKRLHSHLVRNETALGQFAVEQHLTTRLPHHPNLIRALDSGTIADQPYAALEWLPGTDVRRANAENPGTMTPARALAIVLAACDGASHLHAHGWIHGDIHPGNLMLASPSCDEPATAAAQPDRVVLIDLGVCRRTGEAGTVRGTHAYMAPEQVRGEAWTRATDVFALGVVLWELAAGTRLFHRGPPWLSMAAVIEFEPPPLSDPGLDAIARAALAKDPADRTATADELAAAIKAL